MRVVNPLININALVLAEVEVVLVGHVVNSVSKFVPALGIIGLHLVNKVLVSYH